MLLERSTKPNYHLETYCITIVKGQIRNEANMLYQISYHHLPVSCLLTMLFYASSMLIHTFVSEGAPEKTPSTLSSMIAMITGHPKRSQRNQRKEKQGKEQRKNPSQSSQARGLNRGRRQRRRQRYQVLWNHLSLFRLHCKYIWLVYIPFKIWYILSLSSNAVQETDIYNYNRKIKVMPIRHL